jgi:hypothetical protein
MEQKLMNVHTHRSFYLQVPGYILPKLDLRVTRVVKKLETA